MVKQIKNFFEFDEELIEGVIKERKYQFILIVKVKDKEYNCHCPTRGGIGNIILKNIPCLLSKSNNSNRKTEFTVEAISLNKPNDKNKEWIGINQVKSNKYVEYFLKNGKFNKIFKNITEIKREIKLGDSKLDFLINNNCYMEVKSFLHHLSTKIPDYIQVRKKVKMQMGNRLIKHMGDLSKSLQKNQRAILLFCFQYKASNFGKEKIEEKDKKLIQNFDKIVKTIDEATKNGVELWQTNFSINKNGITFLDTFKMEPISLLNCNNNLNQ